MQKRPSYFRTLPTLLGDVAGLDDVPCPVETQVVGRKLDAEAVEEGAAPGSLRELERSVGDGGWYPSLSHCRVNVVLGKLGPCGHDLCEAGHCCFGVKWTPCLGACPNNSLEPSSNQAIPALFSFPATPMTKQFRPWNPEQSFLFPASPRDWLPENHLVYFLLDVIPQMNLQSILQPYLSEERGQPPYHPTMLVTLLLYGYATGTISSRRLMARCETDVAFRVIVGDDIPDFRTISDFRKRHLNALEGLFVDVLKLCAKAGLVKVGRIALDGSKVKANPPAAARSVIEQRRGVAATRAARCGPLARKDGEPKPDDGADVPVPGIGRGG